MIFIPLWLVAFFPKSWQERHIQDAWDSKTDEQIIAAYMDALAWLSLKAAECLHEDCKARLDNYIIPQMKKRGLK